MEKDKTLTTKFDLQTMAEFAVAAEILGARSINALVHLMVKQKIREARGLVSEEEFQNMVERQKEITLERSERKSRERLELVGKLKPKSDKSIPVLTPKSKRKAS